MQEFKETKNTQKERLITAANNGKGNIRPNSKT